MYDEDIIPNEPPNLDDIDWDDLVDKSRANNDDYYFPDPSEGKKKNHLFPDLDTNNIPEKSSIENLIWGFEELGFYARESMEDGKVVILHDGKPNTIFDIKKDMGFFMRLFNKRYEWTPRKELAALALKELGRDGQDKMIQFNSIANNIDSGLKWDGFKRNAIDFFDMVNEDQIDDYKDIVQIWFRGAVARAIDPGCRFQLCLVLVGNQGAMKTTFFRDFAGRCKYTDESLCTRLESIGVTKKEMLNNLGNSWIAELDEIGYASQKENDRIKGIITEDEMKVDPKYEGVKNFKNRHAFCGTTNRKDFMTDETGSRRFIVLRVNKATLKDREQFIAQMIHEYRQGLPIYLDSNQEKRLQEMNGSFYGSSYWNDEVENAINRFTKGDKLMPIWFYERQILVFIKDLVDVGQHSTITAPQKSEINKILRRLGFEKAKIRVPDKTNAVSVLINADRWTIKRGPEGTKATGKNQVQFFE